MRRTTLGVILLILPFTGLFLTVIGYAVASFAISLLGMEAEGIMALAQVINIILGIVGLLSVLGVLILPPIGIYYLIKGEDYPGQKPQPLP